MYDLIVQSLIKIVLIVILMVLGANAIYLDYVIVNQQNNLQDTKQKIDSYSEKLDVLAKKLNDANLLKQVQGNTAQIDPSINLNSNACPRGCSDLITSAVGSIKIPKPTVPVTSSKAEYYIPLGAGQIDQLNAWTDVNTAQTSFDLNNFPKATAVYFEAVLHLANGTGEVRARLYDTSTPYIYAGNEVRSTSPTGELVSVPINLQHGQKNYKVQMYTTISTGVLDSARLKIITQ